ncbi:MAG: T9SS sorting signal type C domain-containing protein, partial [Moheibacter sp.]
SAGNNYATCTNGLGCVAAMGGGNTPNGILTTGQGFIVHTDDSSVVFNNTMRADDSGIFFKVDELESHRFRLNLNGEDEEKFNQILIGYVSEATNNIDAQIDGKMFAYEGSAIYNIIDEEKFVIQGRALPFEASDVVPLGFKAAQTGKFKIALADFDGIFAEGNTKIYLNDKNLNIIHDLMESDYEFESTQGEFKERFEVVYETEETMGTGELDSNWVQIYQNENQIIVSSKTEKILSVELFDLSGRNLHRNARVNSNHYEINSKPFGTQVLVVKVQTEKGEVLTKKIIN